MRLGAVSVGQSVSVLWDDDSRYDGEVTQINQTYYGKRVFWVKYPDTKELYWHTYDCFNKGAVRKNKLRRSAATAASLHSSTTSTYNSTLKANSIHKRKARDYVTGGAMKPALILDDQHAFTCKELLHRGFLKGDIHTPNFDPAAIGPLSHYSTPFSGNVSEFLATKGDAPYGVVYYDGMGMPGDESKHGTAKYDIEYLFKKKLLKHKSKLVVTVCARALPKSVMEAQNKVEIKHAIMHHAYMNDYRVELELDIGYKDPGSQMMYTVGYAVYKKKF